MMSKGKIILLAEFIFQAQSLKIAKLSESLGWGVIICMIYSLTLSSLCLLLKTLILNLYCLAAIPNHGKGIGSKP